MQCEICDFEVMYSGCVHYVLMQEVVFQMLVDGGAQNVEEIYGSNTKSSRRDIRQQVQIYRTMQTRNPSGSTELVFKH